VPKLPGELSMTDAPAPRHLAVKRRLLADAAALPAHARIPSRNVLVRELGVSRTTVDRAISELIGEGVLYARDGSGTYVAERPGAAPARRPLSSWGVLVPDVRHYTYPGILRGIEHEAYDNGVVVIVGNIENQAARQTTYLRNSLDSRVDGVVIVPARPNPAEGLEEALSGMVRELARSGIPFVFCNRNPSGLEAPQVVSNDFHGGFLATRHLIERGYRRIAYIAHPRYTISLNRYMGYASALACAGIPRDDSLVAFSESWDFEAPGRVEMGRMLASADPPDAVVCFTDWIAKGAVEAVCERGLVPGRDVGIVGHDDSVICGSMAVPLTSVKIHSYKMGRHAAALLLRPTQPAVVLEPELAVRQSTLRQ
jgi:DNA-binding LacI/PurR family transcriptional regulator